MHYRFGASPKVARPQSVDNCDERVEAYKKLGENLALLAWVALDVLKLSEQGRFFCQDETRMGLKTLSGHKIRLQGIKPRYKVQSLFKATYFYSVVEPVTR